MGVIRGRIWTPYGRLGPLGPTEGTVGGDWPFICCQDCNEWKDPKTDEHLEAVSLEEFLKNEGIVS